MQTGRWKYIALAEALAVFAAAVLVFRGITASPLRAWELDWSGGRGYAFVEYGAVLLLVVVLIGLTRHGFAAYGILFQHARWQVTVTLAGCLPFLALGASLSWVNWRAWQGALLVSALALAVLWISALALRGRLPPEALSLGAWLVLSPAPAALLSAPALSTMLVKTLYIYLLVGPAEELLFRGYLQSRLNTAWGRPYRFYGQAWGPGLLISAVLFGLWHVALMPTAPGVWGQALWTTCAGLALGFIREKSGSIFPAAFLHSLMNYFPLVDWLV